MDVCFGFRQEQTPHPEPEERLLSRFIFAMKISRATCAKTNHVERVSTQGRMFGLRISAGDLPAPSPLAFTGIDADWLSRAFAARRWFGMMRYRSATVAGFHGLPRCLG
jgi:hypothetical protein